MTTAITAPAIRSCLLWFARPMEAKLRENDWKDSWQNYSLGRLNDLRDEEAVEGYHALLQLERAIRIGSPAEEIKRLAGEFIDELADEANYCMMEATRAATLAGIELPAWDHRGIISRSPVTVERDYIDAVENAVALGQLLRGYLDGSLPSTAQEQHATIAEFDKATQSMGRFANAPQA